jgi:hypothetical protein
MIRSGGLLTVLTSLLYINSKNSRNTRATLFWTNISGSNFVQKRPLFRDFTKFTVSLQPF